MVTKMQGLACGILCLAVVACAAPARVTPWAHYAQMPKVPTSHVPAIRLLARMAALYDVETDGMVVSSQLEEGTAGQYLRFRVSFPPGRIPPACKANPAAPTGPYDADPHISPSESTGADCPGFAFSETVLRGSADDPLVRVVVAHELAHHVLGHKGKELAVVWGLSPLGLGLGVVTGVASLIAGKIHKAEELDADRRGIEILGRLGESDPKSTFLAVYCRAKQREGHWYYPDFQERVEALGGECEAVGAESVNGALIGVAAFSNVGAVTIRITESGAVFVDTAEGLVSIEAQFNLPVSQAALDFLKQSGPITGLGLAVFTPGERAFVGLGPPPAVSESEVYEQN